MTIEYVKLNPQTLEPDDVNGIQYVKTTTDSGNVIIEVVTPPPSPIDPLTAAKQAKLNEIQVASNNALATFTSDSLGSVHTYLSGIQDMLLLEAEDRFMQGPDYDNQDVIWYTIEAGDVTHTKDQIHKLYLDGRAAVQRKKYTAKDLVSQVNAASDVATVNAIDVSAANWS